jgi:hypothetical protein
MTDDLRGRPWWKPVGSLMSIAWSLDFEALVAKWPAFVPAAKALARVGNRHWRPGWDREGMPRADFDDWAYKEALQRVEEQVYLNPTFAEPRAAPYREALLRVTREKIDVRWLRSLDIRPGPS